MLETKPQIKLKTRIALFTLLAGVSFNRISVDAWWRKKDDRLPK